MHLFVFSALLVGCPTSEITLGDDTTVTGDPAVDDTGESAQTEPEPDFSVWNGTRRFYYDYSDYGYYCDETVNEEGVALDADDGTARALAQECGGCSLFYEVTPDQDEVCDWIDLGTTWRGVTIDEATGSAEVHFFYDDDGPVEYASDEDASFDGTNLTYAYEYAPYYDYFVVEISGAVEFPLSEE